MKTTEEMISVMQSYAEGKKIELRYNRWNGEKWVDVCNPSWAWNEYDYRVKPEPKYRPYANADECFADVKKHGGWVKNSSGQYIQIIAVGESSITFADNIPFPYENACRYWVWADDRSVFGVLEGEGEHRRHELEDGRFVEV